MDAQVEVAPKINEYLTIKAAAAFLGVTPNTLRNWDTLNKIKTYRNPQNKYRMYRLEDLESLLQDIGCK